MGACWDCNSPLGADKALEFADDELKDSLEVIMPVSLAARGGQDTACDTTVSRAAQGGRPFMSLKALRRDGATLRFLPEEMRDSHLAETNVWKGHATHALTPQALTLHWMLSRLVA